jgi:hypothetical protein
VYRHGWKPAGTLLLALGVAACGGSAEAQDDWRTFSASRQLGGEDRLGVTVEYGAGTLRLGPAEGSTLYTANLSYDASVFTPQVEYGDGRLRVGMEGRTSGGRNMRGGELDLTLTRQLPLDVELRFGAADAALELGGLRVRRLDVQTGASRTQLNITSPNREQCERASIQVGAARFEATGLGNLNTPELEVHGGVGEVVLDFTGEWASSMSSRIRMGLGSLTLRLPEGLPVRITRTGRLASFDSEGLTKRGDHYYSSTWESAENRLTLTLDAALGSVRVVWVDPR